MAWPRDPRSDRALAAIEIAAVLAVAVLPVPMPSVVLLLVAAASLAIRGARFAGPPGAGPGPALIGLGVGVGALVLALVTTGPVLEAMSGRAVEWAQEPALRGSIAAFILLSVAAVALAVAAELAFRGWIAPRVVALGGSEVGAVIVAALAEAVVTRGSIGARFGVLLLGLGLGALWSGSGRRLGAPVACRIAFEVGAMLLVALRVID